MSKNIQLIVFFLSIESTFHFDFCSYVTWRSERYWLCSASTESRAPENQHNNYQQTKNNLMIILIIRRKQKKLIGWFTSWYSVFLEFTDFIFLLARCSRILRLVTPNSFIVIFNSNTVSVYSSKAELKHSTYWEDWKSN